MDGASETPRPGRLSAEEFISLVVPHGVTRAFQVVLSLEGNDVRLVCAFQEKADALRAMEAINRRLVRFFQRAGREGGNLTDTAAAEAWIDGYFSGLEDAGTAEVRPFPDHQLPLIAEAITQARRQASPAGPVPTDADIAARSMRYDREALAGEAPPAVIYYPLAPMPTPRRRDHRRRK